MGLPQHLLASSCSRSTPAATSSLCSIYSVHHIYWLDLISVLMFLISAYQSVRSSSANYSVPYSAALPAVQVYSLHDTNYWCVLCHQLPAVECGHCCWERYHWIIFWSRQKTLRQSDDIPMHRCSEAWGPWSSRAVQLSFCKHLCYSTRLLCSQKLAVTQPSEDHQHYKELENQQVSFHVNE